MKTGESQNVETGESQNVKTGASQGKSSLAVSSQDNRSNGSNGNITDNSANGQIKSVSFDIGTGISIGGVFHPTPGLAILTIDSPLTHY